MKILIAVDGLTGGAGNIAQIISEYYVNKGEEVYLFLRSKRVKSRYNLNNVHIVGEQNHSSLRTYHKEILYLNRLIKSISPDIIVSFLSAISPQILFSQWFTTIPIIVSERSNPFTNTPKRRYKLIRYVSYWRADLITVQFEVFKFFNKSALRKGKIIVTPNMILSSTIKKNNYTPSTKISFVTCSSLFSVKRIDLMIKLFSEIHIKFPETELNIYGKGINEREQSSKNKLSFLKNLISELNLTDAVKFKGHVSNIYECLVKNDIYLMTSEREGFPNALSEALSVGLPSISFKCHDGLSELIQNGENGYLINEGDHKSFVDTALNLIRNHSLRKQIGEKAIQSIKTYDYNKIMAIWDKYVYSLINKEDNRIV